MSEWAVAVVCGMLGVQKDKSDRSLESRLLRIENRVKCFRSAQVREQFRRS